MKRCYASATSGRLRHQTGKFLMNGWHYSNICMVNQGKVINRTSRSVIIVVSL